jgi:hypothetical protein
MGRDKVPLEQQPHRGHVGPIRHASGHLRLVATPPGGCGHDPAGLLTTLRVDSKLIALLCYEGLLGFGIGIGIQAPQVAASAIFSTKDTPLAIAVVQFGQGIGPAIFISVAQSIFTGRLTADAGRYASGLNATAIENMGLSDLRTYIGPRKLEQVLLGYDDAVAQTLYLPVALTSMSIVGTLAMEWRSVKKKQS